MLLKINKPMVSMKKKSNSASKQYLMTGQYIPTYTIHNAKITTHYTIATGREMSLIYPELIINISNFISRLIKSHKWTTWDLQRKQLILIFE